MVFSISKDSFICLEGRYELLAALDGLALDQGLLLEASSQERYR